MSTSCPPDREEGQRSLLSLITFLTCLLFASRQSLSFALYVFHLSIISQRVWWIHLPLPGALLCDQNKRKQKGMYHKLCKFKHLWAEIKASDVVLVSNTAWWARAAKVWALMGDPPVVAWSWVSPLTSLGTEWDNVWGSPVNTEWSSMYMSQSNYWLFWNELCLSEDYRVRSKKCDHLGFFSVIPS